MIRRSTGRVPMAQPPGIETRASPRRATRGAMTQKLARMVETSSYGAVVSMMVRADRRMVWPVSVFWPGRLPAMVWSTPKLLRMRRRDEMSASRGTLTSSSVSSVRRLAIISGRAAFLAPEIGIEPLRGAPPRMRIRSIVPKSP
jgi:hypothetical protein